MSYHRPFFVQTLLMTCAVAASMLLASPLSAQVVQGNEQGNQQGGQHAALSGRREIRSRQIR